MANKLKPLSSTGVKAIGKTHNQKNTDGTTGIRVGQVEVENGEVINNNGDGTSSIFSTRLTVPNTNLTFAQMAEQIILAKGKIEKRYITEIDSISKTLDKMKPDQALRTHNTHIRTAEKETQNTIKLKQAIDDYNAELAALGELQEITKKELGVENTQSEDQTPQFAKGVANINTSNLRKAQDAQMLVFTNKNNANQMTALTNKSMSQMGPVSKVGGVTGSGLGDAGLGMGLQALASIGTAAGAWMASEKIRKNPIPEAHEINKQSIRTKYDVSSELNDITRSEKSTMDYIKQNTSNSNVANAILQSISSRSADARGRVYARKFNAESQLDARQAQMNMQRDMYNAQANTQADEARYNRDNYVAQLQYQGTKQLMDTAYNMVQSDKQTALQEYALNIQAASSPTGVSNDMKSLTSDYNNRLPFGIKSLTPEQRAINKARRINKRK